MNTAIAMTPRIGIDFHSHCLPGIDDGAVDVRESVAMLREALRQGIHTVVATPHFYYGDVSPEQFFARRDEALATLERQLRCESDLAGRLRLIPGAEVLLRRGVGRLDLRPFCLRGTDAVLLELPFMEPPNWLWDELESIALEQRLTVILAHADRYRPWYSKGVMASVMDYPDLVVQLNADVFLDRHEYRRLREWLPETERLVLGSDMHHIDRRAPHISVASEQMVRHRFGRRSGRLWLEQMARDGAALLREMNE